MSARILITGSRGFIDERGAADALRAALALLGTPAREGVLIHVGAGEADSLLASVATKIGMTVDARPAAWEAAIAAAPDLCVAFPTHGYKAAQEEGHELTSRGTWDCAKKAMNASILTLIVWGNDLYPFGHPAMELLRLEGNKKGIAPGDAGQLPIVEVWLPF